MSVLELRQGQANEFNYLSRLTWGMETRPAISNPALSNSRVLRISRVSERLGNLEHRFFLFSASAKRVEKELVPIRGLEASVIFLIGSLPFFPRRRTAIPLNTVQHCSIVSVRKNTRVIHGSQDCRWQLVRPRGFSSQCEEKKSKTKSSACEWQAPDLPNELLGRSSGDFFCSDTPPACYVVGKHSTYSNNRNRNQHTLTVGKNRLEERVFAWPTWQLPNQTL